MKKILLLLTFVCSFGSAFAAPDTVGCVGYNTDISSTLIRRWSSDYYVSSDPSVATIDSFTGIVHPLTPGLTYLNVMTPGLIVFLLPFHVYPALGPSITGDSAMCAGTTISLSIAASGGIWSSGNSAIATVDGTGVVGGAAAGTTNIVYFSAGACATHPVRVSGVRADTLLFGYLPTSDIGMCVGATISMTTGLYGIPGGTWSSSDPAVATVSPVSATYPRSNVLGISAGTANISYTLISTSISGGCADTEIHYHPVTVHPIVSTGSVTGNHFVCVNSIDSLLSSIPHGSWSSADPGIAIISINWEEFITITGVSAGNTVMTYTFPASACVSSAYVTFDITVPVPDSTNTVHITAPAPVCAGSPASFVATPAGGDWYLGSGTSALAGSIDAFGVLSGVYAGMTGFVGYNVHNPVCGTITGTSSFTVLAAPDAGTITGPSASCLGIADTFNASVTGGSWFISPSADASIAGGVVTTTIPGTYLVLYSVTNSCGADNDTAVLTVVATPVPSPIYASSPTMCLGATVTLSDTLGGGTWHSSDSAVIHLGGTTYWSTVAAPLSFGSATITYSYTTMCAGTPVSGSVTASYTTSGLVSAGTISGPSSVCDGASFTLTSTTAGGTWTSASPLVATVDGAGAGHGLSVGTAVISYEVTGLCNSSVATDTIIVNAITLPGAISGASSVMAGHDITLAASIAGGAWSVSSAIATIDATTGILHGVSAGTVIVTYTPVGCYDPSFVTYTVTVTPADEISGSVYFAPTSYTGHVRVWLIAYSAPMLTAIDSVDVYSAGSSAAYQFLNEPAGTYRIKAAPLDGPLTGTGFIPTYYTSSLYWNTADVITHATATVNSGVNINLMTGTVTTGPGFIGGDVTTGANKGTTDGAPVNNLMMYLLDATGTLYQSTRTDATGHYSFSNIPTGTYYVFPDSLNYATVPYTGITLTSASPSFAVASFIQHTVSHIITPIPVGISAVSTANTSVVVFPNPSSGRVNIAWQVPAAQVADVVVTDVTGRTVIANTLNITAGAGTADLNLGNLVNGLYTISVRSADVNYTAKVQLVR